MVKKKQKKKQKTPEYKQDIGLMGSKNMPEESKQTRLLTESMSKRQELIKKIQQERGSRVISYFTAERQTLGTRMGSDTIPLFFEHLQKIGKSDKIDLFLYTRGGHTLTPNRIVHLLREYCNKLSVLIPFRAHSAGTTLSLGADEILMGPLGELGPVDPSVANDFNPLIDGQNPQKGKIPISVEDVNAYMTLIKESLSTDPNVLTETLRALADKIHPLSLGNVHRQYLLIRSLSKRLLKLHMKEEKSEEKINYIVDFLTEKLYYHGYEISRHEAKEIVGLNVLSPSEILEKLMWDLFMVYKDSLKPGEEPDFNGVMKNRDKCDLTIDGAIIESENLAHSYTFYVNIQRKKAGKVGVAEYDVQINKQGWEKLVK